MAAKKTNGANGSNGHNGHVSVEREVYAALLAREEAHAALTGEHGKLSAQVLDQVVVIDSQAKRLVEQDLRITQLERLAGLQRKLLDLTTDATKVASLEDLSEFWRQWVIHTTKAVDSRKATREDVAKFEPDLFKTWALWLHNEGRGFMFAGSREAYEANQPKTSKEMQEHTIRRLREENAKLAARVQAAEAQLGPLLDKQQQPTKPEEKQP